MSNLPAGLGCAACGARVERTVTDWSDDHGRQLVVDESPLHCPCSASIWGVGRRMRGQGKDGRSEFTVESVFGVRRVEVRRRSM